MDQRYKMFNFRTENPLSVVVEVCLELKSVSKVSRHFAFFVNIVHNFNAISEFSFDTNSYGFENNFQPNNLEIHKFFY